MPGRFIAPVHLPPDIEAGSSVGPMFSTSVTTLLSGAEQVNRNWTDELLVVNASYGLQDAEDPDDAENGFARILDFFRARNGAAEGFLFRDPIDYYADREPLYPVPGQAGKYQLSRTYGTYKRRITRPVAATLTLFNGSGAIISPGSWELGSLGVVTFVNPPSSFTASFEFDIPVAFTSDTMLVNLEHIRAGAIPDVKLKQVRE